MTKGISQFDGGLANDLRSSDTTKFAFTKNFDTLSFPHRLVPYRSYEAGNDTLNRKLSAFLYQNGKIFGRGFVSGTPTKYDIQVYYKTALGDGVWITPTNGTASAAYATDWTANMGPLFIYYNGFIYGVHGGSNPPVDVFRYDVDDVDAFVSSATSLTGAGLSQGVVHSKDQTLYIAGKNKLHKNVGVTVGTEGTWTNNILALPSNYTITCLAEYGNYLAIAMVSDDPLAQTSKVFLWDRDSSVATLSESIDWGLGSLNVLEELEGQLIGISLAKRENSGNLLFRSTLSFKYYAGAQGAVEFYKLLGASAAGTYITSLGKERQKANNRLYFKAQFVSPEGTQTKEGIWSVARSGGRYSVQVEYESKYNNDTGIPPVIDTFFLAGDYAYIAYSDSGTFSGNVSKTNDAETYANNSDYESLIFSGTSPKDPGDASQTKKLIGVTVNTAALPSGASVLLQYRIDSNINTDYTTWTDIFTNTVANSLSHSAVNIESGGGNLPEFNEIQFRIRSLGGAIITGFNYEAELTGKRLY